MTTTHGLQVSDAKITMSTKLQETFDLIVANIRQGRLQPTAAGKLGRDSKAENPPPSALSQAQQGKA